MITSPRRARLVVRLAEAESRIATAQATNRPRSATRSRSYVAIAETGYARKNAAPVPETCGYSSSRANCAENARSAGQSDCRSAEAARCTKRLPGSGTVSRMYRENPFLDGSRILRVGGGSVGFILRAALGHLVFQINDPGLNRTSHDEERPSEY